MRLLKIACLTVAVFSAQLSMADEPPLNSPGPLGDIQAQLEELMTRTQALEDAAPRQSVEGRHYCFVLNLQVTRARTADMSEELQDNVIRRKVLFAGGLFSGDLISDVLNNMQDDGLIVTETANTLPSVQASYTQSGSKIDVTFGNGETANWYVSKDGSLIHGSMIRHLSFGPPGGLPPVLTVGLLRSWTMVETDANDVCDAEFE